MANATLEKRPTHRLRNRFPQLWASPFETFLGNDLDFFDGDGMGTIPSLNIREEKNNYIVEMAAPGLKREDFDINLDGNMLTISSEKESENKEGKESSDYWRREYNYSSFSRTVTLPDFADSKGITAKYSDGILNVTIPRKPEAQKESQKVKVQ